MAWILTGSEDGKKRGTELKGYRRKKSAPSKKGFSMFHYMAPERRNRRLFSALEKESKEKG